MLIRYELKKLLRFLVLATIVFAALMNIVTVRQDVAWIEKGDEEEKIYKKYIKQLEGPLTPEKEQFILQEKEFIEKTMEQEDERKQDYLKDKITKDAYDAYLKELTYCRQREKSFQRVFEDYQYIKTTMEQYQNHQKPWFVYQEYWKKMLSPFGFDMLLIILLMFLLAQLVTLEDSSDTIPIIQSALHGRGETMHAKMLAGGIISLVISIIFVVTDTIIYYYDGYLPSANAPIQSISYFSGAFFGISIGALAVIGALGKIIMVTVISQFFILFSYLIKNKITILSVLFIIMFAPLFFSDLISEVYAFMPASAINFYNLISFGVNRHGDITQMVIILSVPAIYILFLWGMEHVLEKRKC